jgi:hypothetical protein
LKRLKCRSQKKNLIWIFGHSICPLKNNKKRQIKQKGYVSLTEIYIQLNPSLCEPPSTACPDFIGMTRLACPEFIESLGGVLKFLLFVLIS